MYGYWGATPAAKKGYENATILSEHTRLVNESPEDIKAAERANVIWHCDGSDPRCPTGPHDSMGIWHYRPGKSASNLP